MIHEILLTEEAVASPKIWAVPQCVCEFVNDLRHKRHFFDDELPGAAIDVYVSDIVLGQVNNGGFAQYIDNLEFHLPSSLSLRQRTVSALAAMAPDLDLAAPVRAATAYTGKDTFVSLYQEMLACLDRDFTPAGRPADIRRRDETWAHLEKLSDLFFALNAFSKADRFSRMQRAYILRQPNVRTLPAIDWQLAMVKLGKVNPKLAERKQEAHNRQDAEARRLAELEAADPAVAMARKLCALAGLSYEATTAGATAHLDDVVVACMCLRTDKGHHVMLWTWDEAFLFADSTPEFKPTPGADMESQMEAFSKLWEKPEAAEWGRYRRNTKVLARLPITERWFTALPD